MTNTLAKIREVDSYSGAYPWGTDADVRFLLGKVDEVLEAVGRCQTYTSGELDCVSAGWRFIDSPNRGDGYCLPCKIRAILR